MPERAFNTWQLLSTGTWWGVVVGAVIRDLDGAISSDSSSPTD